MSGADAEPTGDSRSIASPGREPPNGGLPELCAHEIFEAQVDRTPDAVALVFEGRQLTYSELERRANQVARALRAMGVGPEARVGLYLDRSIEMMVGLLGILKAGAAYVPLDPAYPRRRLDFMVSDAEPAVILTHMAVRSSLPERAARVLCFDEDREFLSRQPGERIASGATPSNLAYAIYTSGSTGVPKGVLVEHRGLAPLARTLIELLELGADSRVLQWASSCFDASVSEYVMAFAAGASLHLAADVARMPGQELCALLRERGITHVELSPSLLATLPDADLPALRVIISMGEACPASVVARWAPGRRFFNGYGPTEATIWATVFECAPGGGDPPIGYPLPGTVLRILGEDLEPVEAGQVGEICLGGPGVARGYLGRPELTAERFVPDPRAPGARLYRTGDLGRVQPDGAVVYLGRRDHQVKVRGFRVELGEIESALKQHPALREAAVVARERAPGDLRLLAYVAFAPGASADTSALRRFLDERLPEHMIPSAFVALPSLPLTPSGKVDRGALPAPDEARPALPVDHVAPRTRDERALAALWAEALRVQPVGVDDDFFDLGGDSLLAARIVARAKGALGVELGIRDLLAARTVARLARRAEEARGRLEASLAPPLARVDRAAPLPLSSAERRLWFLHELDPEGRGYHLPCALHLDGPIDAAALGRCLTELVRRHEALRTTYDDAGGEPARRIAPPGELALPVTDLSCLPARQREPELAATLSREAKEPFDLRRGPLFRARLFRLGEHASVLFLSLHHIICDGRSMQVLVEELAALLDAPPGSASQLPPLALDYADHAAWERRRLASDALAGDIDHFRRELAGAPPRSGLPVAARPSARARRAGRRPFALSSELAGALRALGRAEGASLFMVLFAGLVATLHRYTGEDDLVVGTPVEGRPRRELEGICGFFANTLVLRARLDQAPTFRALLTEVRERALGAYEHAELPFERLVEELAPARVPGENPLFQVMFALQAPPPALTTAGGLRLTLSELDPSESPFDLLWQVWETAGEGKEPGSSPGLEGVIVHRAGVLDDAAVSWLLDAYRAVLEAMVAAPDARVTPPARGAAALAIEAALLADPIVEDAAVLARPAPRGTARHAAYVVSPRAPSAALLAAHFEGRLPSELLPDAWIPVHALPLSPDGRVDLQAVRRLPVIDADLARRWDEALRAAPGVAEVAVVIEARRVPQPRLHLADLLPGEATRTPAAPAPVIAAARPGPGASGRPPAQADGGPLVIAADEPRTLTEALVRAAAGDRGLTYVEADGRASVQRYSELLGEARVLLAGLQLRGLRAGDRAILHLGSLRGHFTAFWACVLGGIVPVTAAVAPSYEAPSAATARLFETWKLLGGPVLLTSRRLAGPLGGLPALHPMEGLQILAVEDLSLTAPPARIREGRPEDIAFLQLSSGSTGTPKIIQERHRGVICHIHAAQQQNGYTPDDVSLNWLPADHVVPILTWHLRDVYLGCEQIQVATEWILGDPIRWLDLLEAHRVTETWCPNFGFKLVADRLRSGAPGERQRDLSSVRHFMNAGEQVTLPVVRDFLRLMAPSSVRPAAMQPAFGMAEVCTCITYNNDFDLAVAVRWALRGSLEGDVQFAAGEDAAAIPLVDLGPPVPGVQIRITDAQNRVVPEGVIGRLQIKGEVVTPGYLYNEEADREAFVGDGWFNSGDLGFLLHGRLTLTGREKETIIVRGANLACYEVEEIVSSVPGVEPTFAAAAAVDDAATGTEGLAVFFVPLGSRGASVEARAEIAAAIRREVTARLGIAPAFVVPVAREEFPKTTSGKIQRSALKRALAEGRFERTLREIELCEGGAATLPRWFYRRVWRLKEAAARAPAADAGPCLVLLDRGGLGAELCDALRAAGRRAVAVEPGDRFAQLDTDRYRIDPDEPEHYRRLLAHTPFGDVIHCWDPSGTEAALLALIQALAGSAAEQESVSVRLLLVSRRAQPVLEADAVDPERAVAISLLQTAAQELPWLECRHLDLPGDPSEGGAGDVLRELRCARGDREVALRGGARYVPQLDDAAPALLAGTEPAFDFVPGGAYLVTGGLGGIGRHLSRYLLDRFGARLLLIGRAPAPARAEALAELAAAARARPGEPGEVIYEAADVADAVALATAAARAEARWGRPIDGVIHLAAAFRERPLVHETRDGLASVLRPRVEGARAIAALLERRPGAAFLGFSSATGSFGGTSVGAYAAASRFLEHFTLALRRAGRPRSFCFSWSLWDELGMSAGQVTRQAALASGYLPISPRAGLASLRAALRSGEAHLLIGLDGQHGRVLQHLRRGAHRPEALCAYVAAEPGSVDPAALGALPVLDRLGAASACRVRVVARIPRTPDGAVDRGALTALDPSRARRGAAHEAPRDEAERTIAAIWQRALRADRIGVHDNFFDLGGHSLLLAEVRAGLERAFQREVPITDLFRYPTVRALAAYLGGAQAAATAGSAERGRRQRAALELGRQRPTARKTHG
ncbi:amino acid adenylation domain-containing protein [Sorangium sp. So ce1153]|uniref:amino acid adenylation domain-containing protein n=1 Tax=Sorangium sp. So ce1153 TaxID=3133333 RepID=UPI003F633ED1